MTTPTLTELQQRMVDAYSELGQRLSDYAVGTRWAAELEAELTELKTALEESVKLQSHYADLLNMYDSGTRLTFPDADAWVKRLSESKQQEAIREQERFRARHSAHVPRAEAIAFTALKGNDTCPEEGCTLPAGHTEPCDTRLPWEIEATEQGKP